jgi:hypothetical protein
VEEDEGLHREVGKRIVEGDDACGKDEVPARRDGDGGVEKRRMKVFGIKERMADLERELRELRNEEDFISPIEGHPTKPNTSSDIQSSKGRRTAETKIEPTSKRKRRAVENSSDGESEVSAPRKKRASRHQPKRRQAEIKDAGPDVSPHDIVEPIESDPNIHATDLPPSHTPAKQTGPDPLSPEPNVHFIRLKTGPLAYDATRGYTPLLDLSGRDPDALVHRASPLPPNLTLAFDPSSSARLISSMKDAIANDEGLNKQLGQIEQEQKRLLRQWQDLANQRREVGEKMKGNRAAIAAIAKGLTRGDGD